MRLNPRPNARRQLYNVALAASSLLISYGILTAEQAFLWLGLVSAVLGLGLARANVSHGPQDERD